MIHPSDGQTDGRAIAYTRYSIMPSRVKSKRVNCQWRVSRRTMRACSLSCWIVLCYRPMCVRVWSIALQSGIWLGAAFAVDRKIQRSVRNRKLPNSAARYNRHELHTRRRRTLVHGLVQTDYASVTKSLHFNSLRTKTRSHAVARKPRDAACYPSSRNFRMISLDQIGTSLPPGSKDPRLFL